MHRQGHSRSPAFLTHTLHQKGASSPPPTSQPTARPDKNYSSAPVRGRVGVRPRLLFRVEILRRNKTSLEHRQLLLPATSTIPAVPSLCWCPGSGRSSCLCSDGLVDELDDDATAAVLREDATPATACRRLLHAALEKGGRDNISVIVIKHVEGGREPEYELRPEDTPPSPPYRPSCSTE